MSESYTVGGDTLAFVKNHLEAAQTFIPKETHILHWIDLELTYNSFISPPILEIYKTNASHRPTGDTISYDRYWVKPTKSLLSPQCCRAFMQPVTLFKDFEYIMVLSRYPPLGGFGTHWLYDKEGATYHQGHRLYSEDSGETWTLFTGSDHIFAEFGEPPAPPPPPDPPIPNFTILDIVQTVTYSGYHFLVTTNIPCHLYMYWTTTKPEKHAEPIIRRGEYFKDAVRYCFVNFDENEQDEPGDTLYHTFVKAPWPICETRYFVFRATVGKDTYCTWPSKPNYEPHGCYFWEPWGTSLTDNNYWDILSDPDPPVITFADGIITLDFTGTPHSGIFSQLIPGTIPLLSSDSSPLFVCLDTIAVESINPVQVIAYLVSLRKDSYVLYLYLIAKAPTSGWGTGDYGYQIMPPYDNAWIFIGSGEHKINLVDFFTRAASDIGIDPNTSGWFADQLEIAQRQIIPADISFIKNNYFALWRSQPAIVQSPSTSPIFVKHRKEASWYNYITEPWDWYGLPPPAMTKNLITEPWSS